MQERLKGELLTRSTRKLEEEKRRTEELLYSMMPREIAERMKNGDRELTTCEVGLFHLGLVAQTPY